MGGHTSIYPEAEHVGKEELMKLAKEKLVDLTQIVGKDFWVVQGNWVYWVENGYGLNVVAGSERAPPLALKQKAKIERY